MPPVFAERDLRARSPPLWPDDHLWCSRGCKDRCLFLRTELARFHPVDRGLDYPWMELEAHLVLACWIDTDCHAEVFDDAAKPEDPVSDLDLPRFVRLLPPRRSGMLD